MSTIQKALEANKTAGNAERITIDDVTFSRLPLTEPILVLGYTDYMGTRTISELTDIANEARDLVNSTGLTWDDYKKLPDRGPQYNGEISIWAKYGAYLYSLSSEFTHDGISSGGIWHYNYDSDFLVIMPQDASHALIAKYYPTPDEYRQLKQTGFKFKSRLRDPVESRAYFLNTVSRYDAETLTGIVTI